MKNKNLRKQIISAVLAVLLTAGVGTAALASGEPAFPNARVTQPADNGQRNEPQGAPQGEAPGNVPGIPGGEAPSGEPSADRELPENGEPADAPDDAPALPESETPSNGEAPSAEPSGEPSQEFSGEASQEPSGEPGEAPEAGRDSEPGKNGQNAPDAQEPTMGQNPTMGEKERFNIVSVLQDLLAKLQSLLGIGQRNDAAPAQESPRFDNDRLPAGQQPAEQNGDQQPVSGEMNASREPGASAEMGQSSGEMGQSSGEPASYAAANTVTEGSTGASYTSVRGDENAVLVSGDTVTLTDVTVTKTGSSSGESADFYGVNAGILATSGANLTIEGADITTDGTHANGVFSYGSGTVVNISDSAITTSADNSGGIMTTGGATLNAENLTVSTSGNSSAAIRTDRGGGTVNVTDGAYSTSGVGSPAVYSTADITVKDATLTSAASEAVVIEGGNSVTIVDSDVTGNNARLNGQSTVKTNVLIYQSMSGDAAEGSSSFTMTGGALTAGTGAMFHVTNVTTTINLSGVELTYADDSDVFLDASGDAWGTAGKNGGNVALNLDGQDIVGIITMDGASSVAVDLANGSAWVLTGDSYVTSLTGDTSGIDLNGYTLYVGGVAWNG